jgi:hypothetical protein
VATDTDFISCHVKLTHSDDGQLYTVVERPVVQLPAVSGAMNCRAYTAAHTTVGYSGRHYRLARVAWKRVRKVWHHLSNRPMHPFCAGHS